MCENGIFNHETVTIQVSAMVRTALSRHLRHTREGTQPFFDVCIRHACQPH